MSAPVRFEDLLLKEEVPLVSSFANCLQNGLNPCSADTARTYLGELRTFFRIVGGAPGGVAAVVNRANLVQAIATLPAHRESSRRNLFYAVRAFARFLNDLGLLDDQVLEKVVSLKMGRRREPRPQAFLTVAQAELAMERLAAAPEYDDLDRVTDLAILGTMLLTGLRNSEVCRLELRDVSFERGMIQVRNGKGGKSRVVGLPDRLVPLLRLYLKVRPETVSPHLFVTPYAGRPLNRDAMVKRMAAVSRAVGFHVAAHMCRRSFATNNAHQGVPLDMLQVVMGHADVKTTRLYVQTRSEDVAEKMRAW